MKTSEKPKVLSCVFISLLPSKREMFHSELCMLHAQLLLSCLTLCDPMDCSPPGSSVHRILQARILEWVAISFSNACKWKVKGKSLSRVRPSATPWTAAFQAPPSMGFSRQEYWSGVPLPCMGGFKLACLRQQGAWLCTTRWERVCLNIGSMVVYLDLFLDDSALIYRQ